MQDKPDYKSLSFKLVMLLARVIPARGLRGWPGGVRGHHEGTGGVAMGGEGRS